MEHSHSKLAILLVTAFALGACGDDPASDTADARDAVDEDAGASADANLSLTFPSVGEVDPDALAIAAARLGSCVPDDGAQSWIRSHYRKLRPERSEFTLDSAKVNCLASATDGCASVALCTGIDFDLGGPCGVSCSGDVLEVCDDSWRFRIDCAASGLTCDAQNAACVDPAAMSCAGTEITCEQGVPTGCSDGTVRQGYACGDYGLDCDSASCTGSSGACTVSSTSAYSVEAVGISCENDSELNACVNGGAHSIVCSDIASGLGCHTRGEQSFCGLGDECDAFESGGASCDGTSLVICNAGLVATVDCVAAGFTGCSLGGRDGAYCSPTAWTP